MLNRLDHGTPNRACEKYRLSDEGKAKARMDPGEGGR